MTRRNTALITAAAIAGFLAMLAIAAVAIVQTAWFREYVRGQIISATEAGTGGRVEISSFFFDWKHLRSTVTNFVIHGEEPAGAPPYVRADRVQLDIRVLTSLHQFLDIRSLVVQHPQVNIMILADGRSNVPAPRTTTNSGKTPLRTVVDLAVGRFALNDGQIVFASHKQNVDIRGEDLRINLAWNGIAQDYQGLLQFEPIYAIAGRTTPLRLAISVPVTLHRDEIEVRNAAISTARSYVSIDGSLKNLRDPQANARIAGNIAVADLKDAGISAITGDVTGAPSAISINADGNASGKTINVRALHVSLGQSLVEAFGTLKGNANSALTFNSKLALGELGRLAGAASRPDGFVFLTGTARLDEKTDYRVDGNVQAERVSFFMQDGRRVGGINLRSTVAANPHQISLTGARLTAFGAEIRAEAAMQDFERYQVKGNLRNLSLHAAAQALGQKQFALDGILSGPIDAAGDGRSPKSMTAHAALSIARGTQGIPMSGAIHASYSGARDDLSLEHSYVALPHTRLTMSGSVRNRLDVTLGSTDLNDVFGAFSNSRAPVTFNGGNISLTAAVTGGFSAPRITGHLAAERFQVEGRAFDRLDADAALSKDGISVRNASISRAGMQAQLSGTAGLHDWTPAPADPLNADVSITGGDLADIFALAGSNSVQASGAVTAMAHVTGTIGNPRGNGNFQAVNGSFEGQPFDRIQARVDLGDQKITVTSASAETIAGRVDVAGEFQHPRESVTTGRLQAHMQSTPVELAKLAGLQQRRPGIAGVVQIRGDVSATLSATPPKKGMTRFLLNAVNADSTVRGLRVDGQSYGDLTASARTEGRIARYDVTSDFAGSSVKIAGSTQLAPGYLSNVEANIGRLPVERVVALVRPKDFRAKGELSGTLHFQGTLDQPQGDADVTFVRAAIYDEPIDRLRARIVYQPRSVEVQQCQITAGDSHVDLTARFTHPEGVWNAGDVQFRVADGRIDLQRIKTVQSRRPGLGGLVEISANGAAYVQAVEPRVRLRDFNADVRTQNVISQGVKLGDSTLRAATSSGKLNFTLDSNLAMANIHGQGSATLAGDYPIDAQVSFRDAAWSRIRSLLPPSEAAGFEALADGQITVRGPAVKSEMLGGSLQLSRLQVYNTSAGIKSGNKNVSSDPVLQNQGTIAATLDRGVIRIQSAHVKGPQTDVQIGGTAPLRGDGANLTVNGDADLALLHAMSPDIESSGGIKLTAAVRGALKHPRITGQVELHNGAVSYADFGNGLANANGTVLLNGNTATIRNLTAESGGGKLTPSGFVAMRDGVRFGLRASASKVRIRVQQGVSVVAGGDLNWNGTPQRSLVSGTVNLSRIGYAPQTDLASILGQAPTLVENGAPSMLDDVKLDIRVKSDTPAAVQSSLAENLNLDADLQVTGTASHPGALGRVTSSEGQLALFGSSYTVNSGTVGFYNPGRIEPVLDLNLQTEAKGVTVTLRVDGPIDNLKLSYSSDPPLQFQEIISLLAAGATPTSDPTLLANQPPQPQQNFEQMGASALLGKAVADPVAGRLQRVFGVSQLKIDPSFTSGSDVPDARLTLQQRVTTNVMFTYVTGVSDANAQTIRVQWTFNPRWAATVMRDSNGIVSLNLVYKRQIP